MQLPEDQERREESEPPSTSNSEGDEKPQALTTAQRAAQKLKRKLSSERLGKAKEKLQRRGIIYISRIPPHMKPNKLRQMLEPFGDVGRIYLAPEERGVRKDRKKKKGKDTGKSFTEGWVEFEDKKHAKQVALMLNGQPMGGKARSKYKYDLWNIKYLPKFQWDHLTEEVAYLRAVREQRLAVEVSMATKERDFYLQQVGHAKAMEAMEERRKKRKGKGGEGVAVGAGAAAPAPAAEGPAGEDKPGKPERPGQRKLFFGQREGKADPVRDPAAPKVSTGVLAMLAGKKRARAAEDE